MVNRDYFRNLNYAEKLWHVAKNANAVRFAYERLDVHRESAATQMTRIWEAVARSRMATPEPQPDASQEEMKANLMAAKDRMKPVLYEVHFYFVAWTNCGHMLKVITGQPEFLEAKKVFNSFRKTFDHYADARHSFEHFHDRLPGRPDESKVEELQAPNAGPRRVYVGFEGTSYKHSDKSWDISPASLELLNQAIDEVVTVLHRTVDDQIESKFLSA